MLTLVGLRLEDLQGIISTVKNSHPDCEVCVGNYLFPSGYVVSGNTEPVREVAAAAEGRGALIKEVRVSGAFHSQLMRPAVAELEAVLRNTDIQVPNFCVYSNVTGLPYQSVEEIRTGLALQLTKPVLWEDTMCDMIRNWLHRTEATGDIEGEKEEVKFLEVGPGRQLKTILKRIDRTAFRSCQNLTL